MNFYYSRKARIKTWSLRLAEFGLVQGLVQGLTAVAGLLIVRTMSKQDYALFAIANSMQTACTLLADLGIGIGVRSIGGRVCDDRARFGQLLNTALRLRRKLAVVSLIICLPVTMWMLWQNGGNLTDILGLSAVVILGVIPMLGASVFSVSTQLHGEYRRMQKLDFGNALFRLALIGVLAVSRMNALLAAAVGVVTNWLQVFFLRRWARDRADLTVSVNEDDRRELLKFSKKSLPNTIFFCFQGQVTLLILTWLGNPTGVADVTALGRLAMLFGIFSITFGSVLSPRFARCQESSRLPRLYLVLVGGSTLLLTPFVMTAWLLPGPFLWLLGGKYQSLGPECMWVVAAGCVSQVCGMMWSLNSSRGWLYIQPIAFIPTILASQAICAMIFDLRQFHNILIFNLVAAAAPLWIYCVDALIGMQRNKRMIAPV